MTALPSCTKCGASLDVDDDFCTNCGAAAVPGGGPVAPQSDRICPTCNATLTADDLFCTACGGVVDAPDRPPEVMSDEAAADAGAGEEESTWDAVLEQLREVTRGRFEIKGEIGAGGMAAVYLAHEFALDRKVAIKVMSPGWLMEKGMLERFKQEAVTIAALKHPNIITVHGVEHYGQLHFFVLDYIEAGSLEGTINQYGQLPIPVVTAWLTQVGSALEFAHRRGVIHRDIKPANILLDSDGNAIVTDFGIAKVAEKSGLTMTGAAIGTPSYMSPEQCLGNTLTGASDQYALGIVAYKMLAGRTPFQGSALVQMRAHTEELPQPIGELRPDCPADLARTVTCMLEKDPARRWPSLGDTIAAFGGMLPGLSGPVRDSMVGLATGKSSISEVADSITPVTPMPARTDGSASITGGFAKHAKKLWLGGAVVVATAGVVWLAPWKSRPLPDPDPIQVMASLDIQPQMADLVAGESVQLEAQARDSAGANVAGHEVTWTSSDSSVAVVSDGLLTAVSAGTVTVTAAGGGLTSALYLVVSEPIPTPDGQPAVATVSSVRVAPAAISLSVGQSELLAATALDEQGRRMSQRRTNWTARDPAIATITANGEVTARAEGTTVLTAVIDGVRATASVTVEAEAVASVSVSPTDVAVEMGQTRALNVQVRGASGSNLTGRPMEWLSDNPSVATVSNLGVVTGVGAGTSVITVSSGGHQAQATVTVSAAAVTIDQATATAHLTVWIEQFVSELDAAVRRKDMQALRSAYQVAMPAADVAEWETRFGTEADWRVNQGEVFPPRSVGQSWVADFEIEIEVRSGGRTTRGPQRFFVVFEPGSDGLVLTSVEMRLSVQP